MATFKEFLQAPLLPTLSGPASSQKARPERGHAGQSEVELPVLHVEDLAKLINASSEGLALTRATLIRKGSSGQSDDEVRQTARAAGVTSPSDPKTKPGKAEADPQAPQSDPSPYSNSGGFPRWALLVGLVAIVLSAVGGAHQWLTLTTGTWFGVALTVAALLFLFGFSQATYTLRAGLAAAVFVVFLGILLFPSSYTGGIDPDLRKELVSDLRLILAFYFGTEGAVQAVKALKGGGGGGDLDNKPTT